MRDSLNQYFQFLQQQIAILRRGDAATREEIDWEEIDGVLEELQANYEQLQVSLAAAEDVGESLFQQKEDYFELFQSLPIAYLITDANGLILEANQAIAALLRVSCTDLVGHSLAAFVAEPDRASFQTRLKSLSERSGTQIWQMSLCPRESEAVTVELHLAIGYGRAEQIENLRIGVYSLCQPQTPASVTASSKPNLEQPQHLENVPAVQWLPVPRLPQSLDGLRVLVVDDEADIREFVTALLNSCGIEVRAAASAVEALEELERFHPDLLFSDIRMPDKDGYSLVRQIRALETEQGGHLLAVAMTAYHEEDQEKSLQAGFERHFYKLAQPNEWIEIVAELAQRSSV